MKKHVVLMIGALLSLLSCGTKAPEGDLLSLEFTTSRARYGYEYEGRIEKSSNGTFTLTAMKMNYGSLFRKQIGKEEMNKLKEIILKEKMYQYKERYRPLFDVKDGHSWHFAAKFSDGTSIYSSGENATPGGNGLSKIHGYLSDLVADATEEIIVEQKQVDDNNNDNSGYHVK